MGFLMVQLSGTFFLGGGGRRGHGRDKKRHLIFIIDNPRSVGLYIGVKKR